jgi:hypothetical protein
VPAFEAATVRSYEQPGRSASGDVSVAEDDLAKDLQRDSIDRRAGMALHRVSLERHERSLRRSRCPFDPVRVPLVGDSASSALGA